MKNIYKNNVLLIQLILLISFGMMFVPQVAQAEAESLCAKVKIEISQELTLERQAFPIVLKVAVSVATCGGAPLLIYKCYYYAIECKPM